MAGGCVARAADERQRRQRSCVCARRRLPQPRRTSAGHGREKLPVMKEDVLQQIVDDYLKFSGYFTTHNVGFRPRADHPGYVKNQDSVYPDVDVVGYRPAKDGVARVIAVSCKAWQAGFDASAKLAELRNEKKNPKRATWRHFRELWIPKWSEAFRDKMEDLTGQRDFTHRVAVTSLRGDAAAWGEDSTIAANLAGCDVGFLPLEHMWNVMLTELTTTPAASEMGRLAQLLKAAGLTTPNAVAPPAGPAPGSQAAQQEDAEEQASLLPP
jgi:hypothetical protein